MRAILLFFMIITLESCVYDYHSLIHIHNKTEKRFYIHLSCCDSLTKSKNEYDTVFNNKENLYYFLIEPNSNSNGILNYRNFRAKKFPCGNDSLYFFFIKDSVVLNIEWDIIIKEQLYEFKKGYTKNDLDKLDYIVTIE